MSDISKHFAFYKNRKDYSSEKEFFSFWDAFSSGLPLPQKQDTLRSGENIKTINGQSVIGSGDIVISGGSSNSYFPSGW